MTHVFRVPTLTLVLCAPLVTAGCASSPDYVEWIDEAPIVDYTVIPERVYRPVPRVYRRSPEVAVRYTVSTPRVYRPAPTVHQRVLRRPATAETSPAGG